MAQQYKDTVQGTTVKHSVRNTQKEWVSGKGNILVAETHCGRHYPVPLKKKRGKVSCKTCLRALP
jgi:hypothetical protein